VADLKLLKMEIENALNKSASVNAVSFGRTNITSTAGVVR
jgi:hypothetical protein